MLVNDKQCEILYSQTGVVFYLPAETWPLFDFYELIIRLKNIKLSKESEHLLSSVHELLFKHLKLYSCFNMLNKSLDGKRRG